MNTDIFDTLLDGAEKLSNNEEALNQLREVIGMDNFNYRLENVGSFVIPEMDRKIYVTDSSLSPEIFESYIFNDIAVGEYIVSIEYDEGNNTLIRLYLTHDNLIEEGIDITKGADTIIWENLEILNGECIINRLSKYNIKYKYDIPSKNIYVGDDIIACSVLEGQVIIRANRWSQPTQIVLDFPGY